MASSMALPIPSAPPRKRSIFDIPLYTDFTLYDEPNSMPDFLLEDIDLDEITTRTVSTAASFAHQVYRPSMLIPHPYDIDFNFPTPFSWERAFDELSSLPRTASHSRRGSLQINTPPRRNSNAGIETRSSRIQNLNTTGRRLSALLTTLSQCRSNDSLGHTAKSQDPSRQSSRTSVSAVSISGERRGSLTLSHIGAGHVPARMDSHAKDLQRSVATIPVSAFIHPSLLRLTRENVREYDVVDEETYPLRHTRLWSFDQPSLPVEVCGNDVGVAPNSTLPFALGEPI